RPPEPDVERDGEPHLLAIQDLARKQGFERTLQHDLAFAALKLRGRRQSSGPLDEAIVEERHPHLETMGHAGAIDLRQDVAWQVSLVIEILDHAERVRELPTSQVPPEHFRSGVAA